MMKEQVFYNREVLIVLFAGVALILFVVLLYLDIWKPRKMKEDNPEEPESRYLSTWEGIPWSIRVITAAIIFAMSAYTIYLFIHPVNW